MHKDIEGAVKTFKVVESEEKKINNNLFFCFDGAVASYNNASYSAAVSYNDANYSTTTYIVATSCNAAVSCSNVNYNALTYNTVVSYSNTSYNALTYNTVMSCNNTSYNALTCSIALSCNNASYNALSCNTAASLQHRKLTTLKRHELQCLQRRIAIGHYCEVHRHSATSCPLTLCRRFPSIHRLSFVEFSSVHWQFFLIFKLILILILINMYI